ncbi:hypothetical protein BDW59DRAFT_135032 [Aspergillus cavernicola]|uniref:Azaphilone pigments biosynthesis cluster protein L N-terminal domain-containing protein n=1 Tax=Aspergillus cavernicola TaxID=176166 RepID=A0ABR4HNM4_9EURO
MAEAIGLATGVIAIAEAGFKLSKTLYDVGSSIAHARTELTDLAGELDNFAAVLMSVGEIVQKGSSGNNGDFQQSEHLVRTTKQVLKRCGVEFEKIRQMVHLPPGGSKSIPSWDRLRWPFHKSKTAKLKVSLEYSKSSLMLMLQTLHLAVGLHALRSLERISEKSETHRGRGGFLMDTQKDALSLIHMKRKDHDYINSTQLIVKNTVSAICNPAGSRTTRLNKCIQGKNHR